LETPVSKSLLDQPHIIIIYMMIQSVFFYSYFFFS